MDDATEHAEATATAANPPMSFTGFPPSGSTLCPQCDYDLRGLPLEYQCPECGLKYDKATRVWRGQSILPLINTTLIAALMLVCWFSGQIHLEKLFPDVLVLVLMIAIGATALMQCYRQATAAILPEGIILRAKRRFRGGKLILWKDINRVFLTTGVFKPSIDIEYEEGEVGVHPDYVAKRHQERIDFVETANDYLNEI